MPDHRHLAPRLPPDTALIDGVYGETLALVAQARDYLIANETARGADRSGAERHATCYTTSQLTNRLLEIVAWLAACKAVCAGQLLPGREGADGYRLGSWDEGWTQPPEASGELPFELWKLVAKARHLHRRVRRLGARAARQR